jgi:AcrR family transcriptional regulator
MTRRYISKKRAESQVQTRRRIVDATIELHGSVGPLGATVAAIAERAGVSRLTVYRHFPDDVELLRACTSDYNLDHPPPDPTPWLAIADPTRRVEAALRDLYAYYAANESVLANGMDAYGVMPALRQALEPQFEGARRLQELLADGWRAEAQPGSVLHGAIGHAIAFPTWRALRRHQGLTNEQAIQLIVGMVQSCVEGPKPDGPAGGSGRHGPSRRWSQP